ncbi:MAG: ABC transporter ATP-binding protein [Pseudomonadota bacterium]
MRLIDLIALGGRYRLTLALASALMVVQVAATLAIPWFGGLVAADVLGDGVANTSLILAGLLGLFAVRAVMSFATQATLGAIGERILADLQVMLHDHVLAMPLARAQEKRRGAVLSLLSYDLEHLRNFLTGPLIAILPLGLTTVGAVVILVQLDPVLAGAVALLVPLFWIAMRLLGRRLRPLAAQMQAAYATTYAVAEEHLATLPAIKTFTREPIASRIHKGAVDRVRVLATRDNTIQAAIGPGSLFVTATAVVGLLWLASAQVRSGEMTAPELVTFLLYAALLTRPVSELAGIWGQTQLALGALGQLKSVLGVAPEPLTTGIPLTSIKGCIEVRNVHFGYEGREATLKGLNLSVCAGETVAITGENGAGKTTLLHLLARLYAPDSGTILIDGQDIQKASLLSLRQAIGIVPQKVSLIHDTIAANIAYGRPDATREEIVAAARQAGAHEFITKLPNTYDTIIGDDGIRLSGGQRQRVSLARVVVKNPAILVLDEPTAMFDPPGEQGFVQRIGAIFAERTVLLVTHRPASLALADRVVRLEDGVIVEDTPVPAHGKSAA